MKRIGVANRANAGFTLIEVTVSLVAGLIVAMGIVGLSRAATTTFHEEARSAAAESALRLAIDRLSADLQRAGYMSTGNVVTDPAVVKSPTALTTLDTIPAVFAGIHRLAAVYLEDGGSLARNVLTLSRQQSPNSNLAPDLLWIGGNLTTADQFEVAAIQAPGPSCQRILLSPNSPAIYRLSAIGAAAQGEAMRQIFQPIPAGGTTQFIVRVVDDAGRTQYVATCPTATPAGFVAIAGAPLPYPYIDIDPIGVGGNPQLQTGQMTQTVGSLAGYAAGRAWVNPVQIVQWEITGPGAADPEPAQYVNALNNLPLQAGTADPNKYDLMRSFVDAKGVVVPSTSEIVAEYAVDFDIAFTVDSGLTAATPVIQTFPFDSAASSAWAPNVLLAVPPPNVGPQRIRAVRARVVTRAAQGDRKANVAVQNVGTETFLYRYCVVPPCTAIDSNLRWARGRTLTTEVSVPNEARSYY